MLDEVSSFDSTHSPGYGVRGDICMKVFFLIEPVGAIFLSCRFISTRIPIQLKIVNAISKERQVITLVIKKQTAAFFLIKVF